MRASCLIPVLTVSCFLVVCSCYAKRAYMWTDEKGIPHISDQAPPQGVDAQSFSVERDSVEGEGGVAGERRKPEGQPLGSASKRDNDAKPVGPKPAGNTGTDLPKTTKYRDPSTLTRTERIRLTILTTSKERAEQLYQGASSEEERVQWKTELDNIKAEEKGILEVPGT
jgi:hypothetical protein